MATINGEPIAPVTACRVGETAHGYAWCFVTTEGQPVVVPLRNGVGEQAARGLCRGLRIQRPPAMARALAALGMAGARCDPAEEKTPSRAHLGAGL